MELYEQSIENQGNCIRNGSGGGRTLVPKPTFVPRPTPTSTPTPVHDESRPDAINDDVTVPDPDADDEQRTRTRISYVY